MPKSFANVDESDYNRRRMNSLDSNSMHMGLGFDEQETKYFNNLDNEHQDYILDIKNKLQKTGINSNYGKNLYHLLGCILKLSKCFKKYCKETYKACSVSWVLC